MDEMGEDEQFYNSASSQSYQAIEWNYHKYTDQKYKTLQ